MILNKLVLTNLTFSIDGQQAGTFVWNDDQFYQYSFNHSVFSKDSLSDGPHTLIMSPTGTNTVRVTVII